MKIIFTEHARNQITERNISKNEIISTLSKPDKIIPQSNQKLRAIRAIKRWGQEITAHGDIPQKWFV